MTRQLIETIKTLVPMGQVAAKEQPKAPQQREIDKLSIAMYSSPVHSHAWVKGELKPILEGVIKSAELVSKTISTFEMDLAKDKNFMKVLVYLHLEDLQKW
jgi:hypothetical protein